MGKVDSSDAFDILVKNEKERILERFGEDGLNKIRYLFMSAVDITVDVNDSSVKEAYNKAVINTAP